jgi:hypothetical protein
LSLPTSHSSHKTKNGSPPPSSCCCFDPLFLVFISNAQHCQFTPQVDPTTPPPTNHQEKVNNNSNQSISTGKEQPPVQHLALVPNKPTSNTRVLIQQNKKPNSNNRKGFGQSTDE